MTFSRVSRTVTRHGRGGRPSRAHGLGFVRDRLRLHGKPGAERSRRSTPPPADARTPGRRELVRHARPRCRPGTSGGCACSVATRSRPHLASVSRTPSRRARAERSRDRLRAVSPVGRGRGRGRTPGAGILANRARTSARRARVDHGRPFRRRRMLANARRDRFSPHRRCPISWGRRPRSFAARSRRSTASFARSRSVSVPPTTWSRRRSAGS